jgi:hypothetical protein
MDQQQILDAHPKLKAYKLVSLDHVSNKFKLNGSLEVEFIYSVDTFMLLMAEDEDTLNQIDYNSTTSLLEVGLKSTKVSIKKGFLNIFSSFEI